MWDLLKIGDWMLLCLGGALVAVLAAAFWHGGSGDRLLVKSGGKLFADVSLRRNQTLLVPGPLGISEIRIESGRAKVARDPSPRQICVRQGWLEHSGEMAACLPNQVTIEVGGERRYDTLNY
jgi:hypothetical protein